MALREIKIVGVADRDPFDYQTWSGSSYYFFNALKKGNLLYQAVSAQPPRLVSRLYQLLNFSPDIAKWKFKYHIDIGYYRQMMKVASKKIDSFDHSAYNVILQIGAWYDLTKRKDKLTVSYHDGNLSALLNSPWGHPQISERSVRRTLSYEKELYGKVDFIFSMSEWLAGSFVKDFGVNRNKILPVGAGINLPSVREVKNKVYDQPRILFIGRNFSRKGGPQLIEAFRKVKKEVKDATLTIIGPDFEIREEGIRNLGFVSKLSREGIDRLLDEYARASLFVMPSLYEPFGIVFAEAMAHKLPCIGTNVCAMPEIIDNGTTGFTVPPRDIKQLSDRMIELLKAPELCQKMGNQGYSKYINHYTWDRVVKKMADGIEKNCG